RHAHRARIAILTDRGVANGGRTGRGVSETNVFLVGQVLPPQRNLQRAVAAHRNIRQREARIDEAVIVATMQALDITGSHEGVFMATERVEAIFVRIRYIDMGVKGAE
ncbi:conserved hypothetical protein, partial [Ricinus communis]